MYQVRFCFWANVPYVYGRTFIYSLDAYGINRAQVRIRIYQIFQSNELNFLYHCLIGNLSIGIFVANFVIMVCGWLLDGQTHDDNFTNISELNYSKCMQRILMKMLGKGRKWNTFFSKEKKKLGEKIVSIVKLQRCLNTNHSQDGKEVAVKLMLLSKVGYRKLLIHSALLKICKSHKMMDGNQTFQTQNIDFIFSTSTYFSIFNVLLYAIHFSAFARKQNTSRKERSEMCMSVCYVINHISKCHNTYGFLSNVLNIY